MSSLRVVCVAAVIGALNGFAFLPAPARADHICDPVTEEGWSLVKSDEPAREVDSAPYQVGASGDWYVDRSLTVIPFCNYFNPLGIYSMRSYSLAPVTTQERIAICRSGAPVAPYAGPCPPK